MHGGHKAFGGTFLTFSDYSRNALRVAALMKAPSIFVFTYDSIGLGEDGPTHQSIEHVASLRLIPHMLVWRPADTVETAVAWTQAVEHQGPSCLIFSRQNLAFNPRTDAQIANIAKGGYVLKDWNDEIPARKNFLIATGSEVELAMKAVEPLARVNARFDRSNFVKVSRKVSEIQTFGSAALLNHIREPALFSGFNFSSYRAPPAKMMVTQPCSQKEITKNCQRKDASQ